jgi:hypothetical protein
MTRSEPETDETEHLLDRFFKSQVPQPWPACRALTLTVPSGLPGAGRRTEGRSRLTLAAICTALLGLGLVLSSGTRPRMDPAGAPPAAPGLLKSAVAEGKGLKGKDTPPLASDKPPR